MRRETQDAVGQTRPEVTKVYVPPVAEEHRHHARTGQLPPQAATGKRAFDRLVAMTPEREHWLAQVADNRQMLMDCKELHPRNPGHLPQCSLRVGEVFKRAEGYCKVKLGVAEWQLFSRRLKKVNGAVLASALERDRREVDADDLRVEDLDPPLPATDVDCSKTARQLCNGLVCPVIHIETACVVQLVVQVARARESFLKRGHETGRAEGRRARG